MFASDIPITLYIHFPWCVRKCPYCDFNSHTLKAELAEDAYIEILLEDLRQEQQWLQNRSIQAMFLGGGTPSLFSPDAISTLLTSIQEEVRCAPDLEVTLEANPGTLDESRFCGFVDAGVTRLSLGVQSFQEDKLKKLGRIHDGERACLAVEQAKKSGFSELNIDLMFGLPDQSIDDALFDLETAIKFSPTHISWYQLTLEPNTYFHSFPPQLPEDHIIWDMQTYGQTLLKKHSYQQYEISAYCQSGHECRHNMNYWLFGDYIGIGAGAHGKITDYAQQRILRKMKNKHPQHYMSEEKNYVQESNEIESAQLPFEFMLNALRLFRPIPRRLFEERTGLSLSVCEKVFEEAKARELMIYDVEQFEVTPLGHRFLNDLLMLFLDESSVE